MSQLHWLCNGPCMWSNHIITYSHAWLLIIHTGVLFTSEPSNVEVCGRDNATFYCRYEGSTANPDWIINFTSYTSADLPPHHSYHALDGILSVMNIMANQNNTQYQCQLLALSGRQLCAYRSTVGRLIIKCRNKQTSIIPTSGIIPACINNYCFSKVKSMNFPYQAQQMFIS